MSRSSRNSLQDQLTTLSIEIEDKEKNCHLLSRRFEKETMSLKNMERQLNDEYDQLTKVRISQNNHNQTETLFIKWFCLFRPNLSDKNK